MALRTDRTSASTATAGDVRTISGPISGRSGARVVERSAALAQHRIAPAGPAVNSTAEQRPRFVGQEDYRFLGAWDVLATAGVDYAFLGDYSAFTQGDYGRLIDPNTGQRRVIGPAPQDAYGEAESDYGQIGGLDSSLTVTSRTATTLDDDAGRAAAFVRSELVSQGPNNLARGNARSSAVWGTTSARKNDDVFGGGTAIQPTVPNRRSGAGHAVVMRGTTYRGSQRPSIAMRSGNAGTVLSRNGTIGSASDQLSYVAATRWSAARSQNVALGTNANVDFEVGRR
ncbi:hypothetical protein OEZ86_004121 [Tetradesmus obliquus]|nr:hypothetical protein OEZ86_004121 [Tetradesmus obliquus]